MRRSKASRKTRFMLKPEVAQAHKRRHEAGYLLLLRQLVLPLEGENQLKNHKGRGSC